MLGMGADLPSAGSVAVSIGEGLFESPRFIPQDGGTFAT